MKIVIEGRPISKKNSKRIYGKMLLPSVAFTRFQEEALWQLKSIKEHISGKLSAHYVFYMKGNIETDFDNMIAGVNDIIQAAGIIDNDKDIKRGSFEVIQGNDSFRSEITLLPLHDS